MAERQSGEPRKRALERPSEAGRDAREKFKCVRRVQVRRVQDCENSAGRNSARCGEASGGWRRAGQGRRGASGAVASMEGAKRLRLRACDSSGIEARG